MEPVIEGQFKRNADFSPGVQVPFRGFMLNKNNMESVMNRNGLSEQMMFRQHQGVRQQQQQQKHQVAYSKPGKLTKCQSMNKERLEEKWRELQEFKRNKRQ